MIQLFIISLFATFVVVRILAYAFHDMKNYGSSSEKSKTPTGFLRLKTGLDIHHFHFGILILLITIPFIFLSGWTDFLSIFLAIGISLVADQIIPIFNRKSNYFYFINLLLSFAFHIIISISAFLISRA